MELLLLSLIIVVCIAAGKLSYKLGLPSLLMFIVLGMLFGSDGIFKIPFDNYTFAEQICSYALIIIMFYGGFGTNWKQARPVAGKAVLLSTLGVVATAAFTGLFCRLVLGFEWLESFLIGSVISSTDAASVFAILRQKRLNLKYNTASLLEIESGSNDPFAYMLTITCLTLMSGQTSAGSVAYMLFAQIVYGALIGAALALAAVWLLKRINFYIGGMDTLFVLAIALLAYAVCSVTGGNGYLAVYIAGIILGNSKIKNKAPIMHFFDGITNLSQIIVFFLLGLLAFPSQLPQIILPSLAIALFLTFIARPVTVFGLLSPFKSPVNQQLLVSFAGLRGASSIVFAIMATVNSPYTEHDVFHIVFFACLLSVGLQGALLPVAAKKLKMVEKSGSVLRTFNDYQEDEELQLIKTKITKNHAWAGKTISELKLALDILVVMIKRGDQTILPNGRTRIKAGDILVLSGEMYKDDSGAELNEIEIGARHKWANKCIREITLPANTLIIAIKKKNGRTIIPRGGVLLEPGDNAVLWTCEFTQDVPEESQQDNQLPAVQTEQERRKKALPPAQTGLAGQKSGSSSEQAPVNEQEKPLPSSKPQTGSREKQGAPAIAVSGTQETAPGSQKAAPDNQKTAPGSQQAAAGSLKTAPDSQAPASDQGEAATDSQGNEQKNQKPE